MDTIPLRSFKKCLHKQKSESEDKLFIDTNLLNSIKIILVRIIQSSTKTLFLIRITSIVDISSLCDSYSDKW